MNNPINSLFGTMNGFSRDLSRQSTGQKEHDEKLHAELCAILPDGTARYIHTHNFGEAFERGCVDALLDFDHACDNPQAAFLDKKLERAKKYLHLAVNELIDTLSSETFPARTAGFDEIPARHEPEKRQEIISRLHQQAANFFDAYVNFVKSMRRSGPPR